MCVCVCVHMRTCVHVCVCVFQTTQDYKSHFQQSLIFIYILFYLSSVCVRDEAQVRGGGGADTETKIQTDKQRQRRVLLPEIRVGKG